MEWNSQNQKRIEKYWHDFFLLTSVWNFWCSKLKMLQDSLNLLLLSKEGKKVGQRGKKGRKGERKKGRERKNMQKKPRSTYYESHERYHLKKHIEKQNIFIFSIYKWHYIHRNVSERGEEEGHSKLCGEVNLHGKRFEVEEREENRFRLESKKWRFSFVTMRYSNNCDIRGEKRFLMIRELNQENYNVVKLMA